MSSHNQICIWAKRFEKDGIDGLKSRTITGRKSSIYQKQLDWVENVVLNESPTKYKLILKYGHTSLIVNVLLLACNLNYSDDAVYALLKEKLGFTRK